MCVSPPGRFFRRSSLACVPALLLLAMYVTATPGDLFCPPTPFATDAFPKIWEAGAAGLPGCSIGVCGVPNVIMRSHAAAGLGLRYLGGMCFRVIDNIAPVARRSTCADARYPKAERAGLG